MANFATRTVFFVRDAPAALEFYTRDLGFNRDWVYEEHGRPYVVQVSLHGLEIILNQNEPGARDRAGDGRIFIGLDEAQSALLMQHIERHHIEYRATHWGGPTLALYDQDQNELFFWLAGAEKSKLEAALAGAG